MANGGGSVSRRRAANFAVPAHHTAEAYLDAYTSIAGSNPDSALFRSASRQANVLTERAMSRGDTLRMIKRRARCAGISHDVLPHISCYGDHGVSFKWGTIENAQAIAAHESPRTTKLYDRTSARLRSMRLSGYGSDLTQRHDPSSRLLGTFLLRLVLKPFCKRVG